MITFHPERWEGVSWGDLLNAIDALMVRQAAHLQLISNLTKAEPQPGELKECRANRAALIAEVGTLRSDLVEQQTEYATLMSEVGTLHADLAELQLEYNATSATCDRLSDLLSRTGIALKGPEPELGMHSWHDLPEVARAWRTRAELAEIDVARTYTIEHEAHMRGREVQKYLCENDTAAKCACLQKAQEDLQKAEANFQAAREDLLETRLQLFMEQGASREEAEKLMKERRIGIYG